MSKLSTMKRTLPLLMLGAGIAVATTQPVLADDVTTYVHVPAKLSLKITGDCSNTGRNITLGPGTITVEGVTATVLFDGGGSHDQTRLVDVPLKVILDKPIEIPKQPPLEGVTGNPNISIWIGESLIFGPVRCNKLTLQ